MGSPAAHAESSVRRFGGTIGDYLPIHEWFDATVGVAPNFTHRALRHHDVGVRWCVAKFGRVLAHRDGGVPTEAIARQHLMEDHGRLPRVGDWFDAIELEGWMGPPIEPDPAAIALSSARRFGGQPDDFLPIHEWFAASPLGADNARHRALLNHTAGLIWCEEQHGSFLSLTLARGRRRNVAVRDVARHHLKRIHRRVPTPIDWLQRIEVQGWMWRGRRPTPTSRLPDRTPCSSTRAPRWAA